MLHGIFIYNNKRHSGNTWDKSKTASVIYEYVYRFPFNF